MSLQTPSPPSEPAPRKEFGGEVRTLDEWEVAYVHRSHHAGDGACARVTWTEADPEAIDRVVEAFRTSIMPRVEQLDGFCSASLMIDRARGRGCVTASYDSTEAMAHAADTAMGLRADLVQETGMRVMEVDEFELALAHLDVPELVSAGPGAAPVHARAGAARASGHDVRRLPPTRRSEATGRQGDDRGIGVGSVGRIRPRVFRAAVLCRRGGAVRSRGLGGTALFGVAVSSLAAW